MPDPLVIERLTDVNFDRAIVLLERFFREEGFTTPRHLIVTNLRQMLSDTSCWGALATCNGEDVGVVTVTTALGVEFGRSGEIGDLYVDPKHRGRGVAERLVTGAIEWCTEMGCSAVAVTVTPEGEERHGLNVFYKKLRFNATGRTVMIIPLLRPER